MTTNTQASRRNFLKTSAVIGATAVSASTIPAVHAAESDIIKIGLIGCGGRGCGAVADGISNDPNVKLVAIADVFEEKVDVAAKTLREQFKERVDLPKERCFAGFDGYKSVIPLCDVVFLCTPQHFRPMTLKAAIEAGKHVFCEKPVAVDATGIRSVLESAALAKQKGLNVVSGLINRYSNRVRDVVKRIHDGQIGTVVTARANRMGGPLWVRRRMEGDTEMKYQMRNWVNFNWLASEFINDVTIHQLDVALWCMGDELTPVNAFALGGRIVRTQPDAGDMYDTMSVVYEYADGKPLYAFSSQIPGGYNGAVTYVSGAKGGAEIGNVGGGRVAIFGENPYDAPKDDTRGPYFNQHTTLYNAIRSGGSIYVNDLFHTAKATMAAILGRMAAYSGKKLTWEEALNSKESFTLDDYSWDAVPPTLPDEQGRYKLALPGRE
jgi:predicted dehydrogenase